MKFISAAAGLLLCLTILTSCGVSSASSVDGTTASVSGSASVTAVTDAQTTASAAAAGTQAQTAASTAAAGSTAAQTESTAPAQDSTAAGSESAASSAQSSVQTSAATSATEQQSSARNLFDEIRPGMDCTAYITANKGYTLQKDASCMGEGEDRVYTYSDYKIISYFENGKDIIQEIVLTGKGVAARSGLKVGMTTDDIERVFGVPAVPGEYIYPSGNGYIDFLLEADNQTIRLISFYTEEEPE